MQEYVITHQSLYNDNLKSSFWYSTLLPLQNDAQNYILVQTVLWTSTILV